MVVYDITNRDSFEHILNWIQDIKDQSPKTVLIVLVGNKIDLEDKRVVSYDEGSEFAIKNGFIFEETSAKTGQGIEEIFTKSAKEIVKKMDENYYDLIITGDLGVYGEEIFKKYCNEIFNIDLKNYYDSATKVYDMNNKKVLAGGSGPSCLPSYVFSYIIPKMKNKEIKRVLLLATGALLSTTSVNHKKSIPCICHAICLEAI